MSNNMIIMWQVQLLRTKSHVSCVYCFLLTLWQWHSIIYNYISIKKQAYCHKATVNQCWRIPVLSGPPHIKAVKICTPASPSLQVQEDRHKLNDQVQVRYPGCSDDILFFSFITLTVSRNINIKDFTIRNGLPASKLVKLIITSQFTHVVKKRLLLRFHTPKMISIKQGWPRLP